MKAQLKMAKGGVTKLDGDKFAEVVEPFLDGAKVRHARIVAGRFCDFEQIISDDGAIAISELSFFAVAFVCMVSFNFVMFRYVVLIVNSTFYSNSTREVFRFATYSFRFVSFFFFFRFGSSRCVSPFCFLRSFFHSFFLAFLLSFFLFLVIVFFPLFLSRVSKNKKDRMESLEADYAKVQEGYNAAAKRFGEDPTKVPSGDFFALVSVRFARSTWLAFGASVSGGVAPTSGD